MHLKDGGVELVATTRDNVPPSLVLEFLRRLCTLIKDYCGHLSEEAIRKNFVLVYELLDEALDYGVPQNTSTDTLKSFVLNEPSIVAPPVRARCCARAVPVLCDPGWVAPRRARHGSSPAPARVQGARQGPR